MQFLLIFIIFLFIKIIIQLIFSIILQIQHKFNYTIISNHWLKLFFILIYYNLNPFIQVP